MKKIIKYIILVILSVGLFSCAVDTISGNLAGKAAVTTEDKFCNITVSIMVPDYNQLAESRAIAPQTYDIVLMYKSGTSWMTAGSAVRLSTAAKEAVADAPVGFPGSKVTANFGGLPVKNYEAGSLKVCLRDSSQNVLTSGTNTQTVNGVRGGSSSATFYTVPEKTDGLAGSLTAGQMRFAAVSLQTGTYTATVTVGSGNVFPDLVLFDETGKFCQYRSVTGTNNIANFNITVESNRRYYLGIWAKSTAINSYTVQIKGMDMLFLEDFEDEANKIINNWITPSASENSAPPTFTNSSDGAGFVNNGQHSLLLGGKAGQTSTMGMKVTLDAAGVMTFYYRCRMKNMLVSRKKSTFAVLIDGNQCLLPESNWVLKTIKLTKGTHTIKFSVKNPSTDEYSSGLNGAIIDDIVIKPAVAPLPSLNETFENGLDTDRWTGKISADTKVDIFNYDDTWYDKYGVHSGMLHDYHGKCLRIDNSDSISLENINLREDGALTFWYKANSRYRDPFKIMIDGQEKVVPNVYMNRRWQRITYPLSAGPHTIKFINSETETCSTDKIYNHLLIDDVTITADGVDNVEITPRGIQQTYIGGHKINFKANALRSDGSVIDGMTAVWSVDGGGTINASTGVFTPTEAGTFKVTATVGGKSVSNDFIVHTGKTSDPVTIWNYTFTGPKNDTAMGSLLYDTDYFTFDRDVMPTHRTFQADGYFILAGKMTKHLGDETWRLGVEVKNSSNGLSDYSFIRYDNDGCINERIWLRYGSGEYEIRLYEQKVVLHDTSDLHGNKDRGRVGIHQYYTPENSIGYTFYVNNTNTLDTETASWLLPSYICCSDDYRIQNVAADIAAGLPSNAPDEDTVKALYDWEADWVYYDYTSIGDFKTHYNLPNKCRRSDYAIDALLTGAAVCEGYANLFAALARNLGFKTKVMISPKIKVHAWNQIYVDNTWLVVDVTGGRGYAVHGLEYPEKFDCTDTDPGSGRYGYFLMDRGKHSMYSDKPDQLNEMGEFLDEYGDSRGEQRIVVEEYDDFDATECSW